MTPPKVFVAATNCPAGTTGNDRDALFGVEHCRVLVVADGAQGQQGGVAADVAIAHVRRHVDELVASFSCMACERALELIDQEIHRQGSGGLTTGILIVVDGEKFVGASVGDSEVHLFRRDETVDVTANQARKPFLGSGRSRPVGFGPHALEGRLLVGTDGLFKYGKAHVREDIVRTAPIREVAWRLVDSVRLRSGNLQDDVTVYVLERWDDPLPDFLR